MRKIITYALLITILLQITGCGIGAASETAQKAADNYVTAALSLPQEYIMTETIHQNVLYYLEYLPAAEAAGPFVLYRLDLAQEGAAPEVIPFTVTAREHIVDMTADGEGKLNLLIFRWEEKGDKSFLTDVSWVKLAEDGHAIAAMPVGEPFAKMSNPYITGFEIDAAGNAYIAYGDTDSHGDNDGRGDTDGSTQGVLMADAGQQTVHDIKCEENVDYLCRDQAGAVYAFLHDAQGRTTMAKIDSAAKTMASPHDLSWLGNIVGAGSGMDRDQANELFLASDKAVYRYNVADKTYTEQFQWEALDLAADYRGRALALNDGRFLWIDKKYGDSGIKASFTLIRPRREDDSTPEAKTVLTLGGISAFIDGGIREAIVDFNRTHPNYRIEITEYGRDGDIAAGTTRLNGDIVGGSGPDLLVLPPQSSLKIYAAQGVLTDLTPYLEQDSTIKRADLQENILDAYETDEKLYGMPISYLIQTLMGRSTQLSGRSSWNLDEMIAFADRLNGEAMFLDASKSSVLRLCLMANGDNMVSLSNATDGFNRELFLKILEFANRFTNDADFPYDDDEEMYGRIDREQVQLEESGVSDFTFGQIFKARFGEPATYVGYPAENGSGSLAMSTAVIAIGNNCDEKDAAWQFISSMLTEEFQAHSSLYGFPIRKSGLAQKMAAATEATYQTDENGRQQEVPKGGVGMGAFYTDLYAATAEEVQAVEALIEQVDKTVNYDEAIMTIIQEESQGYFSGGKTAAEVADIVENRIRLYLSETVR